MKTIKITMYSLRNCGRCNKAKKILDAARIKYVVVPTSDGRCSAKYPWFNVTFQANNGETLQLTKLDMRFMLHLVGHGVIKNV